MRGANRLDSRSRISSTDATSISSRSLEEVFEPSRELIRLIVVHHVPAIAEAHFLKMSKCCAPLRQVFLTRLEPLLHPCTVAPYPQHGRLDAAPARDRFIQAIEHGVDALVRGVASQNELARFGLLCPMRSEEGGLVAR